MTSQVVLMNSLSVAIASDSVISTRDHEDAIRTRSTSEKIIRISGEHQVLCMTSGLSAFHQFPYEVLLWEWSRSLKGSLDSVKDYANSFIQWLANSSHLRTEEIEGDEYIRCFEGFFRRFWNASKEFEAKDATSIDDDFRSKYLSHVKLWTDWVEKQSLLPGLSDDWAESLSRKHNEILNQKYEYWFGDDRPQIEEAEKLIKDAAKRCLSRSIYPPQTDLVFTGFGEAELLPHLVVINLYGLVDGRVRRSEIKDIEGDEGYFHFFGQADASVQFVRGIDWEMKNSALNFVQDVSEELAERVKNVAASHPDEDEVAKLLEDFGNLRQNLRIHLDEISEDQFVSPFMKVLNLSPEADLAKLAESIVNIESMRQAIDKSNPTVGGPIDVAVISKLRGCQWVRHKSLDDAIKSR